MGRLLAPRGDCFRLLASTGTVAAQEVSEGPVRVFACRPGPDASAGRADGWLVPGQADLRKRHYGVNLSR